MISKIYTNNLFAKFFTLGLILLFANILKDFFGELAGVKFPDSISTVLFVAGLTICLVSLMFLLIEWITLPFGMKTKRIKLYQGAGNLIALLMLIGAWFFKEEMSFANLSVPVLGLTLTGLITTLTFGFAGKEIADTISRKKVIPHNLERSYSPNDEIKKSGGINTNGVSHNPAA